MLEPDNANVHEILDLLLEERFISISLYFISMEKYCMVLVLWVFAGLVSSLDGLMNIHLIFGLILYIIFFCIFCIIFY